MTRTRSERGFSLVELLIVLCILSLLLRMSLPAYAATQRNARAAQAVGDFEVIKAAAFAQYEATGSFPPEGSSGVVPDGMAQFLPKDYSFHHRDYQIDWESWVVSDTSSHTMGSLVAVRFAFPDEKLGLTVLRMLGGNCTHWSAGDSHTFVVQNSLESAD